MSGEEATDDVAVDRSDVRRVRHQAVEFLHMTNGWNGHERSVHRRLTAAIDAPGGGLAAAVARVRALHAPQYPERYGVPLTDKPATCAECLGVDQMDYYQSATDVPWPCPTVRALDGTDVEPNVVASDVVAPTPALGGGS